MQAFQNHLIGWEEVNETTGKIRIFNNISIALLCINLQSALALIIIKNSLS
jgi:hypothetical protein